MGCRPHHETSQAMVKNDLTSACRGIGRYKRVIEEFVKPGGKCLLHCDETDLKEQLSITKGGTRHGDIGYGIARVSSDAGSEPEPFRERLSELHALTDNVDCVALALFRQFCP